MNKIFFLLAVVLLIAAIYMFFKSRQAKAASTQETGDTFSKDYFAEAKGQNEFNPENLGPGAIIRYGATDYVVRGTMTLNEGPYYWYEYLLDGGDNSSWLGVEVDEGQLNLTWWTSRKGAGVTPDRGTVEFEGVTYSEDERGHARYTSTGTTGLPESGEMRYVDYSAGDKLLGFEGWANNDSWEVSTGHTMLPGEFTVYPAPKA